VLEVRGVETAYGDVQVLWGASLAVAEGEVVSLIGPNGAGKTTLLRTIMGLHRPLAGQILLEGEPLQRLLPHQIAARGLALVPEGRRLFGGMRVLENLEVGAYSRRARPLRAETLRFVYDLFPLLAERRDQLAATLSGGQQQMLAIGRALMGRPRLLLLEEPSLGLAPIVVQQIFAVLGQISHTLGVTVLLVEQNAHLALELAQRAYILERGRVVGGGPADELLADPQVRQAYLGFGPTEPAERPA
jgi:branched-chain amino acid transport system ATP-binding protein